MIVSRMSVSDYRTDTLQRRVINITLLQLWRHIYGQKYSILFLQVTTCSWRCQAVILYFHLVPIAGFNNTTDLSVIHRKGRHSANPVFTWSLICILLLNQWFDKCNARGTLQFPWSGRSILMGLPVNPNLHFKYINDYIKTASRSYMLS
jgi:hypothetical protein